MTEEQLNRTHIGASFEKMRGKAVSERMRRDWFFDAGQSTSLLAGLLHGTGGDMATWKITWKEPFFDVGGFPIGP